MASEFYDYICISVIIRDELENGIDRTEVLKYAAGVNVLLSNSADK